MPCIRSAFIPAEGPLVKIGISAPGTRLSESPHRAVTAWALIDTGAELSSIFASVAEEANILPSEMRDMVSANHVQTVNIYMVNLQVHLSGIIELPGLEVAEFAASRPLKFRALLGRDVLCRGLFSMGKNAYRLCL